MKYFSHADLYGMRCRSAPISQESRPRPMRLMYQTRAWIARLGTSLGSSRPVLSDLCFSRDRP